jgi:hypothetical protein
MDKFRQFLKKSKSSNEFKRVVLGNTSSDMDSVVGATVFAYFLSE